MRHAVKGRKLGRTTSHREAMFRNQLQSLVDKERIITTLPKAKELRPLAERLITRGKLGTVHARRWALRWLLRRDLVKKLFDDIAPRFSERPGGYLRIVKLGPRLGDGGEGREGRQAGEGWEGREGRQEGRQAARRQGRGRGRQGWPQGRPSGTRAKGQRGQAPDHAAAGRAQADDAAEDRLATGSFQR